jgi:hypothetical protein
MAGTEEHPNIPRRVVEELVDVLVFAPIGLASTVLEELPGLVEKGRSRVTVARTIGRFAVVMGRQRIGQAVSDRTKRPAEEPPHLVVVEDQPAPGDPGPEHGGEGADSPHADGPETDQGTAGSAGVAGSLAIPGYDSLAASQVVQRLAGLSPEELDAVRRYEESTRRRRTILGRISQLSSGWSEPEHE